MKQWMMIGALGALTMVLHTPVSAEDMQTRTSQFTEEQRQEMQKMFQEWLQQKRIQEEGMAEIPPPVVDVPSLGQTTQSSQRSTGTFTGGSTLEGGRTVYAKPFVKVPKTIVGGYIDFTITDCHGGARDCRKGLEFDQERFVPFFYSQVTDRLSVATEVEIEHGGPQSNQGDGDVKIEFATMDYRFEDWLNLRGGIILLPIGRFNLIHDSPLNDLPLRPMVSRLIIPSTFGESGIGLFGTVYPTQLSKLDYEFYITQGFDGDALDDGDFEFTEGNGLRGIRGSMQRDNNENKAIVSRVSISPILGVEVAGSVHHGKWDDSSDHDLTIFAVDGLLQRGPFEIMGEAAWVSIEGGRTNPTDTRPPSRMEGYYVQMNYHFMPDFLKKWAPSYFSDASTFTGVIRWGEADTNTDNADNENDLKRLTLGVNYRPVEDAAIKFSYTFNDEQHSVNSHDRGQNNGWQFSMTTYF